MIYYRPHGNEVDVFRVAASRRLPVLLKGPTGCGKTRFVRFMAEQLGRPLITVACQEDLAAADLTALPLAARGAPLLVRQRGSYGVSPAIALTVLP